MLDSSAENPRRGRFSDLSSLLALLDSVAKRGKVRGCEQRSPDAVIEEREKISLSIKEERQRRQAQARGTIDVNVFSDWKTIMSLANVSGIVEKHQEAVPVRAGKAG